jgi:hypothetical protein
MKPQKHPILERLEKLEKRKRRSKTKEDVKEFVLLVAAIVFASFIYDGIIYIWNLIY